MYGRLKQPQWFLLALRCYSGLLFHLLEFLGCAFGVIFAGCPLLQRVATELNRFRLWTNEYGNSEITQSTLPTVRIRVLLGEARNSVKGPDSYKLTATLILGFITVVVATTKATTIQSYQAQL